MVIAESSKSGTSRANPYDAVLPAPYKEAAASAPIVWTLDSGCVS